MMYNIDEEFVELNSMELDETVLNKKKKKFSEEELEELQEIADEVDLTVAHKQCPAITRCMREKM